VSGGREGGEEPRGFNKATKRLYRTREHKVNDDQVYRCDHARYSSGEEEVAPIGTAGGTSCKCRSQAQGRTGLAAW